MYPYGFGPEKCAITITLLLHRLRAEPIMKSHLQGTGQSWMHHQGIIEEIDNQWCRVLYGEIWLKSCTSPTPALACALFQFSQVVGFLLSHHFDWDLVSSKVFLNIRHLR